MTKSTTVVDHDQNTIIEILEKLLAENSNITARAVARLHPTINAASSITRSEARMKLLIDYQARQSEYRAWMKRTQKLSKENINVLLENKSAAINNLEMSVAILTISHVHMIRAVGELGGFTKWSQFFSNYKETRNSLYNLSALPSADVMPIQDATGPINRQQK